MRISILIYLIVPAVVFGVGVVLVPATPLTLAAMTLQPAVIAASLVMAAPVAWFLAP